MNERPPRVNWRSAALDVDSSLSWSARLLICALVEEMGGDRCYPSRVQLAHRMGVSVRLVANALAELERAGWLDVDRRGGVTNSYRRAFPPVHEVHRSGPPTRARTRAQRGAPGAHGPRRTQKDPELQQQQQRSENTHAQLNAALAVLQTLDGYPVDGPGRDDVEHAYDDRPDGVLALIGRYRDRRRAGRVKSAGGALVRAIRRGDHLDYAELDQELRSRAAPCPSCGIGGGRHAAGCPGLNGSDA